MSVPAGPEVPMQMPMLPALARVYPSAMCEAPSTCRASTCLMIVLLSSRLCLRMAS